MTHTVFLLTLGALLPALICVMRWIIAAAAEEFKEGNRGTGLAMIALTAAMVLTALPWSWL